LRDPPVIGVRGCRLQRQVAIFVTRHVNLD
jgi:hypothetical protein